MEQEILRRFHGLIRLDHGLTRLDGADDAIELLHDLVDEIVEVEHTDVHLARDLLDEVVGISSRDALHVAVMRRLDVDRVLSFDRRFDRVPDLERVH